MKSSKNFIQPALTQHGHQREELVSFRPGPAGPVLRCDMLFGLLHISLSLVGLRKQRQRSRTNSKNFIGTLLTKVYICDFFPNTPTFKKRKKKEDAAQ